MGALAKLRLAQVKRCGNAWCHVVILVSAQATREDHAVLLARKLGVLLVQRVVLLVVQRIVRLVAGFQSAGYSRVITVSGRRPPFSSFMNSKCLCSMMRVKGSSWLV